MLLKIQNQWINPQAISRLYKTSSDQFNVEFVHGGLFCCTYIDADREQNAADCERDLQRILEAVNGVDKPTNFPVVDLMVNPMLAQFNKQVCPQCHGAKVVLGSCGGDPVMLTCRTCRGNGFVQIPIPTFTLPTEPVGGCHDFQVVSSEQAVRDVLQPAPVVVGRTDSRSFPNYPLHGKFESAVKGG